MNSAILKFIVKAFIYFVGWYLAYELWLLPDGKIDYWLAINIVEVSKGLIQAIGYNVWSVGRIIGIEENIGIEIVDRCTGISVIGLYLSFMFSYPGDWKDRISFCTVGLGVIYLVNILRVITLIITQEEWDTLFSFTHNYSTTAILYIVIFILWMIWVKYNDRELMYKK